MEPIILRLPRVDRQGEEPEFVLLHVSAAGRDVFDLKLIGTEGAEVFSVSLRHGQISSLKGKKSKIAEDEWEIVLSAALLGTSPAVAQAGILEGVEAVAKVEDDSTAITISIQKRIEGITQKLGTISLPATESEEVEPYEWCGIAIQARDSAKRELNKLRTELTRKDEQIAKLEQSFEELIKLKGDNEDQLLEKFSLLLNEKKLKIRDQQRLLASSTVDPAKLETVQESRIDSSSRSAGPSRGGKRKAGQAAQLESEDSDDGFEKMDVDAEEPAANDSGLDDQQTPDASTADEETADDEPPPPHPKRKAAAVRKGKGKAPASKSAASEESDEDVIPPKRQTRGSSRAAAVKAKPSTSKAPPPPPPAEESDEDALPPKRELPFSRPKKPSPPSPKITPAVAGSDTESDDEL